MYKLSQLDMSGAERPFSGGLEMARLEDGFVQLEVVKQRFAPARTCLSSKFD